MQTVLFRVFPFFVLETARRAGHLGLLLALIWGLTAASCATQKSAAPPKDIRLPEGLKTATSVAKKPDAVTKTKLQVTHYPASSLL